jgi:hypothetical protein
VSFYSLYMDRINSIEHVALLYCIAITSYWKPHTVWSFLYISEMTDTKKGTEHLYTLPLGNEACACTAVVCQVYGGYVLVKI